jgi:hypothetical protein
MWRVRYLEFVADLLYLELRAVDVFLLGDVVADHDGRGVDHGDELGDSACGEEADGVGGAAVGLEGEAGGHVVLPVEQHALVVLVDDDSDFLALAVLCRDVDVLLLPVGMQLHLELLRYHWLYHEIVESPADKRVRFDVGISHVVLGSKLVLPLRYLLGFG